MIKTPRLLLGALFGAALVSIPAVQAQTNPSTNFSITGQGVFLTSDSTSFNGSSASVKFKSIDGGGVEVSYQCNSQFIANVDVWAASADLTGGGVTLNTTATAGTVGGDWLIAGQGPVTPYVGIDLGDIHYSGNGVSETDFIYGGHIGVRYNFDRQWFGKLALQVDGTQLKDSTSTLAFVGGVVALGCRF